MTEIEKRAERRARLFCETYGVYYVGNIKHVVAEEICQAMEEAAQLYHSGDANEMVGEQDDG